MLFRLKRGAFFGKEQVGGNFGSSLSILIWYFVKAPTTHCASMSLFHFGKRNMWLLLLQPHALWKLRYSVSPAPYLPLHHQNSYTDTKTQAYTCDSWILGHESHFLAQTCPHTNAILITHTSVLIQVHAQLEEMLSTSQTTQIVAVLQYSVAVHYSP